MHHNRFVTLAVRAGKHCRHTIVHYRALTPVSDCKDYCRRKTVHDLLQVVPCAVHVTNNHLFWSYQILSQNAILDAVGKVK